ncbi:hypothetical protein GCM10007978_26030 [Shewanella hanedai]|jgi:hypothetical protein|uniref:Uncharacterized protein n=1 Tax=Shewanella hanedai TaxID=25 RepID=A0A553JMN9_SHEHA|nr:hypothetical protein [Shewanella hanedai]TRY13735.1 hypothetical protein FN961_13725 [Shewanella hanedai]GGI87076.1 hypothetical protein GCM10007978_26030 [Shewanella hanedai]
MESIISIDELLGNIGTPEHRLKRYQACLNEFDQLNYDDPFIRQIRAEMIILEKKIQDPKSPKTWFSLKK